MNGVSDIIYNGELYDLMNSFDHDLDFYAKWCKKTNGKVLELCCGTGRISIPLKEQGINITGMDLNDSMLEQAKIKAAEKNVSIPLIKGDMRSFQLDETFDIIFIPFNSIQNTYEITDVERIFEHIQLHLSPNGLFIMDIFNPSIHLMVNRQDKYYDVAEFTRKNGDHIKITEMCKYDAASQVNHVTWKHEINGEEHLAYLNMRCFFPLEMDALLKYNNFDVIHKFGDYDESDFYSNSRKQLYICKKGDLLT